MPSKATVHGVLMDANLAPVVRGKIIATLNGSDMFEGGARIVTQKVEAATDAQGQWSMALLVNAEGDAAATSWTIEGYNEYVVKVFEAKSLFIATPLAIALGDLEKTSAQNLRAARDAGISRLLVVQSLPEYQALPEAQRRDSDIVLVRGA
jgi:hypothetical protein